MVKEVEIIDSSVCQASMLELPVGGGWVGVASFVYLFIFCFFVFFFLDFQHKTCAFTPRENFSLFIFFFSATHVSSVQRGLQDERHPTSN